MNEDDKQLLKLFWDNAEVREAVKKALFLNIDGYKIKEIGNATNEEIGAEARATIRAKEILQSKFNSISQFGTQISKVDTGNLAE